ncbi:hypothetical protein K435DRAFT_863942, partial [Dendrothele bispora CBS 962.96]
MNPSTVFAKGFGLVQGQTLNTSRVGLGFGLVVTSVSPLNLFCSTSDSPTSSVPINSSDDSLTSDDNIAIESHTDSNGIHCSFLAAFVHHNGFGNSCSNRYVTPSIDTDVPE